MIGDVSSTNDFFLKPDARKAQGQKAVQKNGPEIGPAESVSNEATQKLDKKSLGADQRQRTSSAPKGEFARKLKSLEVESREKPEFFKKLNEQISGESKSIIEVAPIKMRRTNSEGVEDNSSNEIESLSDPDAERFSVRGRSGQITTTMNEKKYVADEGEASIESASSDDASSRDVDSQPNLQLMAILASPQFNIKDLSASELKEVKEALRDQQAELKQASVQKFMGQLQSQYGITPEKVVQAFAKMDEKTLTAPPSETISHFVDNLNVKGGARQQIANLYKQMLNETGEAALNEKLLGDEDTSKSVSLKVMDSTQAKLDQLNKSLDSLNDSFFRKGQFQPQNNQQIPASIKDQLKKLTQANQNEESNQKASNGLEAMLAKLSGAGGLPSVTSSEEAVAAPLTSGSAASGSVVATAQAPLMDMSAHTNSSQSFDQGEASENNQRGTKNYESQNIQASNGTAKNFSEIKGLNLKSDGAQVKAASASTNSSSAASVAGAAAATATVAGSTSAALSPQQMMMTGPSKQDSAENVQELIKHAQVIIKKGGGEMNVEMKPEGMGQVHLKVALDNGQVNIQMMAQNDKVKKLLEEGIHELKGNLAAHRLQVESLKIGIANGLTDSKMEQQQGDSQREAMRDAQRSMAGNFAGEMRDQRNDRNSGFSDSHGLRSYRTEPKRRSVEATPDEMNYNRRDESRRLSVFA